MGRRPRRPVGVEALLRWHEADRGSVSPGEIIALAEDTQLIGPLGEWILDRACAAFVALAAADARIGYVCVNISPRQFRAGIAAQIGRVLTRHGLEPHALALDLTESLIANERDEVWEQIEELRKLGVRLLLDDFGTGISSLGHLKRLSPDAVKIQSAYLAGIVPDTSAAAMIGALIAMAHSLEIRVISEGVEDAQQAELLELLGCDYAQGYFFSAPCKLETLIEKLADDRLGPTGTA